MDTIKLLLVEDDPSLRYIVQSGLEDIIEGYEVLAAANGEEGLAMWREHRPDVILSDIETFHSRRTGCPYSCFVETLQR